MAVKYLTVVNGQSTLVSPAALGGSQNAGQIPILNPAGALDISMMPSGVGATTETVTASSALSAATLVNVYNNSGNLAVRYADNSNVGSFSNGFLLSGVASGAVATVYLTGVLTGLSGLTPGAQYFLGNAGAPILASSLPTTSGTLQQQIGTALSATSIAFQPGPAIAQ